MSKKKYISIVIVLIIIGYIILSAIPNIFIQKIKELEKIKTMQIIAHRGGAGIGIENTLLCINKGIALGANMIEIDVHLSKDGHLIVCHDQTVDRTTNGKGKIRELTLQEIRKLKIVDYNGNITDENLPLLYEVIELVNGRVPLLVEIKQPRKIYKGIEQKLLEEIEKYNATSWIIVQSFNDSVLENIHKINPEIRLEKLLFCKFFGLPLIFDGTISKFNFKKYTHVSSFNISFRAAAPHLIKKIHQQGKEVKIWTLSEPEKLPNVTIEGVITDRPDLWTKLK